MVGRVLFVFVLCLSMTVINTQLIAAEGSTDQPSVDQQYTYPNILHSLGDFYKGRAVKRHNRKMLDKFSCFIEQIDKMVSFHEKKFNFHYFLAECKETLEWKGTLLLCNMTDSPNINTTTQGISTTLPHPDNTTTTEGRISKVAVAGVIVGVVAVIFAVIILLYYFTKYRHNRFDWCKKLKSRTWSTGSNYSQHNPLEPDETGTSEPPPRTARQLFSITDNDHDDDGFIYDEIFDASEFTDEKTRRSIKHLYTATRTQDEIPDLNLRI